MTFKARALAYVAVALAVVTCLALVVQGSGRAQGASAQTGELLAAYRNTSAKGNAVSMVLSPDGNTLYIAVVSTSDGLQVVKLPVTDIRDSAFY